MRFGTLRRGDTGGDGATEQPTTIFVDTTSATGANEIAKVGGFFDERLGELGISVEYTSLGTSSQMLEGIAAGKLDFTDIGYPGLPVGVAAGVDFRLIGAASTGGGDVVFVAPDGPQTIAELAGKKVAAAKGSSGWALLVRALADAGLSSSDLEIVDLKPDEAQNAFLQGDVDAWAIWSGQATAIDDSNGRQLTSGEDLGLIPGALVTRTVHAENDALLAAYLGARQDAIDWLESEPEAAIQAIADDRGMDYAVVESFLGVSGPLNLPLDDALVAEYQQVADLFFAEGEIATEVDISTVAATDAFERAGL
ncbi:ABC transporter substrate-binding protein [Leucobacter soli]|uniref:ABC transporter substrate-binding protein n=1 Tax=Leucobacter soli TaxID=2812850 RepID=UPI0036185647